MAEAAGNVQSGLLNSLRAHVSDPLSTAVADFGRDVSQKLGRGGDPEDQLRGPAETLLKRLGSYIGVEAAPYGEVRLKTLRARPDYAVDVGNRRVGYIELKAPGRGIPPDWKPNQRERRQWDKLTALPNVIYTDGTSWARYKYGEVAGPIARLTGSLGDPRQILCPADAAFETIIREFLLWEPEQPRSLTDLIRIVAGLCRLLRDEVTSILRASPAHAAHEDLTLLAADWRSLLFPGLEDSDFADAYAQTVTFAMLLARIDGVILDKIPLHEIGRQLGKKHSLMGRAFTVLTDSDATDELRVIETLRQVIASVRWDQLDDGQTDIYAVLYEKFLAQYNPDLRKKSGSYYTPQPVARFMVDFVDEILCQRLSR
ncbi:MAG TPA: N-6 DNA methylase [Streptosporangiaceae bacterium]|nr:N-6 DNA methylase [Streptosporangiaceae bacterium]